MFFLILILNFIKLINSDTNQKYEVIRNKEIPNSYLNNIILFVTKSSRFYCIAECNKEINCLTLQLNTTLIKETSCSFYNISFYSNKTINSSSNTLYVKNSQ
jgi:hypothetical protein